MTHARLLGALTVLLVCVLAAQAASPCNSCASPTTCPSPVSTATCSSDGSWRVTGNVVASEMSGSLGCALVVNGSFSVPLSSVLQLKSCALISSLQCVTLQGELVVDVRDQSLSSASQLTLLEFGCASGQFTGVKFLGIPSGVALQGQVTYEQNRVVARFTGSGVTPGPNEFVPVPAPQPPSNNGTVNVNCLVGFWTVWNPCADGSPCGTVARNATQCTERWVEVQPQGTGTKCPELTKCRACTIPACNCTVQCRNGAQCSTGSVCKCIGGYTGNDCSVAIDYCAAGGDDCIGSAACVTTGPGTFNCTCPTGTFGNGRLGSCPTCGCVMPNACFDGRADCDNDADCSSTSSSPFFDCICPPGYRGTGHGIPNGCVPINPCNDTVPPCHDPATCLFIGPGQSTCMCPPGYLGTGIGFDVCRLPCSGTCATTSTCPSPHTNATCAGSGLWEVGAVGQNTTLADTVVACKTRVLGNLDVPRGTTLSLRGCASIQVDGCVVLDGFLSLDMSDFPPITPTTQHVLINSTCVSGAFRGTSTSGVRGLLGSFVSTPTVTSSGVRIAFTLTNLPTPVPSAIATGGVAPTPASTTSPTTTLTTNNPGATPTATTSASTTSATPASPTTASTTTPVTSVTSAGGTPTQGNPTTTGPGPAPNPPTTTGTPTTTGAPTTTQPGQNPPIATTQTTTNPNPNPNPSSATTNPIPVQPDAAPSLSASCVAVVLAVLARAL